MLENASPVNPSTLFESKRWSSRHLVQIGGEIDFSRGFWMKGLWRIGMQDPPCFNNGAFQG
jgi:hypothetical protein